MYKFTMRFSTSGVSVAISAIAAGGELFLIFKGNKGSIAPNTEFGKKVELCNIGCRESKGDSWLNFKYNASHNVWFRPLRDVLPSDFAPFFPEDFEVLRGSSIKSVEEPTKSHEVSNVRSNDNPNSIDGMAQQRDLFGGRINDHGANVVALAKAGGEAFGGKPNLIPVNSAGAGLGVRAGRRPTDRQIERVESTERLDIDTGAIRNNREADSFGDRIGSTGNYTSRGKERIEVQSSKKGRIAENISAIKILKNKNNDREYSDSEKEILAAFTGWGGMANEVVSGEIAEMLNGYLTLGETSALDDSALFGYYTDDKLASAHWDMLIRNGFSGGRILDQSTGIGKYITNRDPSLDEKQHFTAVDIDPISAGIARALHPSSFIFDEPFQSAYRNRISDERFDLVIGNIPFGELKIVEEVTGNSLSIHNYFLKKAIELTRPGGVISIITTTHTLDSKNSEFREDIAEDVQLLSALRLPNGLFSGTSVSADVLTLRKKTNDQFDELFPEIAFAQVETAEFPAKSNIKRMEGKEYSEIAKGEFVSLDINQCFSYPNCFIAGKGFVDTVGAGGRTGFVVEGTIDDVIARLREIRPVDAKFKINEATPWFDNTNLFLRSGTPEVEQRYNIISDKPQTIGNLFSQNGKIYRVANQFQAGSADYRINGVEISINNFTSGKGVKISSSQLVADYVTIREVVRDLLVAQSTDSATDDQLESKRIKLNTSYDKFTEKYGYFHDRKIRKILRCDADFGMCLALENYDEDNLSATKSDIFTTRVVRKASAETTAKNLADAATLSLMHYGNINVEFIEAATGKTISNLMGAEKGIVFLNPETQKYEHRISYLVGNVVEKLRHAEKASAGDPFFNQNVDSLTLVLPPRLSIKNISVGMGAGWLDFKYVENFIKSIFSSEGITVSVALEREFDGHGKIKKINIALESGPIDKFRYVNDTKWGGTDYSLSRILKASIYSAAIKITKTDSDGASYTDAEQSMKANHKVEQLKEAWSRWIISNEQVSSEIENIYNEKINVYSYDVDYSDIDYKFPSLSSEWNPRPHQKAFVLSALTRGSMLNADPVGAGKTGMQVMLAYELKRLKLANLPIIIVPNHMLYQTAAEAQQLYPSAKICIVTKEDMNKENRLAFTAKMAMNTWDFAVITYSMFRDILPPKEYLVDKLGQQLDEYKEILDKSTDRSSSRQILLKIKTLREKQEKLLEKFENKSALDLSHLGIDTLLYDEFHGLKNLSLDMEEQIPGISNPDSTIALVETMKMNYVRDTFFNGAERGVYGFTATPISNTAAELYTISRQIRPSLLVKEGVSNFNEWCAQYGEIVTGLEVLPEGKGFQVKSRLSSFKNIPELLASFRSFTQCHTMEELKLPTPDCTEHVVPVEPTVWQRLIFDNLFERAKLLRERGPSSGDNFLSIVNEAATAAISHRALYPEYPLPNMDTKVYECAKNAYDVFKKHEGENLTQLIFCDRSIPSKLQYSAYNEIKTHLTHFGIPVNKIAFIHDCKSDEERFSLFKKVRAGEVWFLFGSTSKLGTGTNVQNRIIALHDLDLPWKPTELEQRRGRGVRQGNINKHIDTFRYTTKGSFDVFRLETLSRKQRFISMAMSDPRKADRVYTEDDKIDFDTMVAATSDNPIVKQKADIDAKLSKLNRQYEYFLDELYQQNRSRKELLSQIASLKDHIESGRIKDYIEAKNRKDDFIALAPNLTANLGENASEELKLFEKNYDRLSKLQFTILGVVPDVQDGDTMYINFSEAKKSLSAALIHCSINNSENVEADLFGERLVFTARKGRDEMISECYFYPSGTQDAKLLYRTSQSFGYKNCYHHGKDIGHLLSKAITFLGVDIEEFINNSLQDLRSKQSALALIPAADLNAQFPRKAELDELRVRQKEVEVEIMKLIAEKGDNKSDIFLPTPEMAIEAYIACGCDQNFDPYDLSNYGIGMNKHDDDDLLSKATMHAVPVMH